MTQPRAGDLYLSISLRGSRSMSGGPKARGRGPRGGGELV